MKNKKTIILLTICCVLVIGMIVYSLIGKKESNPAKNYITNAVVAKDVSMLFMSNDDLNRIENDRFDGKNDNWYVSYMNGMYELGYFSTKDIKPTEADAYEIFTYRNLDSLFTNIGIVDKKLLAYVNNNKASAKITYDEWKNIYDLLVEQCDKDGNIQKKNIVIAATPSNVATLEKWTLASNAGKLKYSGINVDYYIDKEVSAYIRDDELLLIGDVISEKIAYKNAWVVSIDGGKIKTYVCGVIREFVITDKISNYSNVVADLTVEKKKLTSYTIKEKTVSGKVMAYDNEKIEIDKLGVYNLSKDIKVYKTFGTLETKNLKDILVGYDMGKFFVDNDEVVAVVLDRDVNADNIRVLIMNTGFTDIFHDLVEVSSDTGIVVTSGDNVYKVNPGEVVRFDLNNEQLKNGRIILTPEGVNSKITINSIERGYGNPSYRGTIELAASNGRIVVINELPVEKYLLSVVPSEMPYTYNIEALKTQAVCARSYAIKQIKQNSYSAFGAHVDDSTNYQVYNNSLEQEASTIAVEETYGKVITYEGEIINAYFFSTSCGSSTDTMVWGTNTPYIKGKLFSNADTDMDLTDNTTFDSFIRMTYETFDSEYPWYRWNVTLTLEDITKLVNENISKICDSNQSCVYVKKSDGSFVNEHIDNIGNVKKIEIGDRGQGGVLNYIIIYGSDMTIRVDRELNIRKLFNMSNYTIKRLNGSDVNGFSLLPSAYVIFDPIATDNLLSGYNIIGGGYGHGVGMSQNGANFLGKNGCGYEEIIQFFYENVKVEKIY